MATSHWWQRCSTLITSQNPFKEVLNNLSQFFVRSEVVESSDTQVAAAPRAKSNLFCSDSGFAEPTIATPLATSASQPIVTIQSSNLFRRYKTVSKEEKQSELSAGRRIRKPVKLPEDFDEMQPLKEYLLHFERCSLINGWTDEEKAMFLAASLRGESRKLLSGSTESEGRQYAKIVERLQLPFGVEKQAELHQARLLNRRLSEDESLQMLATDIRSMVDLAYQDLFTPAQDRFAVQHFINALSDKDDRLYLRREKASTLDVALSLTRELESLGLLDSSNSLGQADTKVKAIETEQTQLQTEVYGLKHKIEERQHQLEAQANIIAQLHQFLAKQRQPQGPVRGGWECWICGENGNNAPDTEQDRNLPSLREIGEGCPQGPWRMPVQSLTRV